MLSKYNDYQSNIHNCQTPNNQCMTLSTMSNIWRCRMPTPPPSPQTLQQRCVIAAAMPPLSHANAAVAANPAPTPRQSLQQRHRCRMPTPPSPQTLRQRRHNCCSNTAVAAHQRCWCHNPCPNAAAIAAATPPRPHANTAIAAIPAPTWPQSLQQRHRCRMPTKTATIAVA